MAEPVETTTATTAAVPRARAIQGDRAIAMLLRAGAVSVGLCFVASIIVSMFPATPVQGWLVDYLRQSGVVLLIVTPVLRLVAAGVLLGVHGEWRYAAYAAFILLLLAIAAAAGFEA
ncbi:MAG: hypothetical protein WBV82_00140 [Myxococcaceae bacterium]